MIKNQLKIKRVRSDTFGYLQRSFPGLAVSATDAQEARMVGRVAVEYSKDPAKRPRGVPPKVLDDLGAALAQTSAAAADIAPTAQGCAGASNPRCADLYLKLNQGQTALINAYQALAQYGTRTPDAVQNLLYT